MASLIEALTHDGIQQAIPLDERIAALPQLAAGTSLGEDIDQANTVLLDPAVDEDTKRAELMRWVARRQPCLFGRLGAHESKGEAASKGLGINVCWIGEADIALGADHVSAKIQRERRAWKDRAEAGAASGFLIMFNSARLAYARPSRELVALCVALSDLYLVEHAPIRADVIYTEAVPLRRADGQLTLFKAGCNIFYGGAHRTVNHDRRVPGGLLFSMNSPGHYANSLALRGLAAGLDEAIDFVRETAYRSVGNGGIGHHGAKSTSWHNTVPHQPAREPERRRPAYVPPNFDPERYSATYHTDVLVPTDVTVDGRLSDGPGPDTETWPYLILDYITSEAFAADHVNYGLFHGHPIEDCDKYHNPWPSRVARNEELFEY
ncbi:hypothetical protein [Actinacidiphila sp. ITFR-21]|uniref:hypothetical protein n=1 Tax=Actinacidiphila sp. ITFR-21 TaxID=3075199 RepID=UPI002889AA87|nr:hypothetical protein [Streptomyces sp. ITFR-21]WNI16821.1 hypothetical protein RLT57_15720 [Streptomyces sp. ITFR-21]